MNSIFEHFLRSNSQRNRLPDPYAARMQNYAIRRQQTDQLRRERQAREAAKREFERQAALQQAAAEQKERQLILNANLAGLGRASELSQRHLYDKDIAQGRNKESARVRDWQAWQNRLKAEEAARQFDSSLTLDERKLLQQNEQFYAAQDENARQYDLSFGQRGRQFDANRRDQLTRDLVGQDQWQQSFDERRRTDERDFDYGQRRDTRADFERDRAFGEGVRQYDATHGDQLDYRQRVFDAQDADRRQQAEQFQQGEARRAFEFGQDYLNRMQMMGQGQENALGLIDARTNAAMQERDDQMLQANFEQAGAILSQPTQKFTPIGQKLQADLSQKFMGLQQGLRQLGNRPHDQNEKRRLMSQFIGELRSVGLQNHVIPEPTIEQSLNIQRDQNGNITAGPGGFGEGGMFDERSRTLIYKKQNGEYGNIQLSDPKSSGDRSGRFGDIQSQLVGEDGSVNPKLVMEWRDELFEERQKVAAAAQPDADGNTPEPQMPTFQEAIEFGLSRQGEMKRAVDHIKWRAEQGQGAATMGDQGFSGQTRLAPGSPDPMDDIYRQIGQQGPSHQHPQQPQSDVRNVPAEEATRIFRGDPVLRTAQEIPEAQPMLSRLYELIMRDEAKRLETDGKHGLGSFDRAAAEEMEQLVEKINLLVNPPKPRNPDPQPRSQRTLQEFMYGF